MSTAFFRGRGGGFRGHWQTILGKGAFGPRALRRARAHAGKKNRRRRDSGKKWDSPAKTSARAVSPSRVPSYIRGHRQRLPLVPDPNCRLILQ